MKEEIKCRLCSMSGVCHGYQRAMVLYQHYRKSHPTEFKKLKQAKEKYRQELNKHKWTENDNVI